MKKWLIVFFGLFSLPTLLYAKGIVVGETPYFKVNFSGQVRMREEVKGNYYTQTSASDTLDYLLIRTRLALDFQGQGWGVFLMGQQGEDINGRELNSHNSPTSQDFDMDIQQLYLYLNKPQGLPFSFWIGRKEVRYDREALIGTSTGWGNYVFSYDGGMVTLDVPKLKIDCFYMQKRQPNKNGFDNWFDNDHFYGYWFTYKDLPWQVKLDQYFLVKDKKENDDIVYTLGFRVYDKKLPTIDFDTSFVYQWGNYVHGSNKLDRSAYAVHAEAGYKFTYGIKQRIGIEYNYASGDDNPNDHDYGTFDKLYGADHGKYGLMDFFTWKNMHELQINHTIFPTKRLRFKMMLHAFWLATTKDAWYDFTGNVLRPAPNKDVSSYVGTELDFHLLYKISQHFTLISYGGHFFAGSYVKDTATTSDGKGDANLFALEIRLDW